jgi:hypothetical protein
MHTMRLLLSVAAAVAIVTTSATAHVVIPTEFRQVVSDSSLIVRGRVTDVRSVEGQYGIDSIATVAVENVIKGHANGFVYVRMPGGQIGNIRWVRAGVPTLRAGQRAVFFLRPGITDTSHRPIGLSLGLYRIQPDPRSGRPVVEPPVVAGMNAPVSGTVTRGDTRRKALPVAEFESLVKLVMATPPAAPGTTPSSPGRAVPRSGIGGGR